MPMNSVCIFGRAIPLPGGLKDYSEYTFDSGDELMAIDFDGPSRGESLDERVKKLRARLQGYLADTIRFVQDEEAVVGGHAVRMLAYEGTEGDKSIQIRHLFVDTRRAVEPWAQMRYRSIEQSWAEIDRRFSLDSLNLELGTAAKPAAEGKSRHRIREMVFDLPREMGEETLYRFRSVARRVGGQANFKILVFRDQEQTPKAELNPESLRIVSAGASYERSAGPASAAQAGFWYRSTFPSSPPRQGFHYGERLAVPGWAPRVDSLIISSTTFEKGQVEAMSEAIAELSSELRNVRR